MSIPNTYARVQKWREDMHAELLNPALFWFRVAAICGYRSDLNLEDGYIFSEFLRSFNVDEMADIFDADRAKFDEFYECGRAVHNQMN